MQLLSICNKMTFPELKYFIKIIDEYTHPDLIFFLLRQCREHVFLGTRWSEFGIYDFELIVLRMCCQQNHILREINQVLAKNQHSPLDHEDADKLDTLLEESDHCHLDWSKVPISKNSIWIMIDMANAGYQHQTQVA